MKNLYPDLVFDTDLAFDPAPNLVLDLDPDLVLDPDPDLVLASDLALDLVLYLDSDLVLYPDPDLVLNFRSLFSLDFNPELVLGSRSGSSFGIQIRN